MKNARYEERYTINITTIDKAGRTHNLIWNYGGRGFTKGEAENIIRCRLEKDSRVKSYTMVRMPNSIITKIS